MKLIFVVPELATDTRIPIKAHLEMGDDEIILDGTLDLTAYELARFTALMVCPDEGLEVELHSDDNVLAAVSI